jgi:long-chain acyl-CoA synthetase
VEACCVTGAHFAQPFALLLLSAAAMVRCQTEAGRTALQQSLQEHLQAVNARLDAHERLGFLAVVADHWTPENGMVTPTLKVKRARVEEAYGAHYANWLAQKQAVVWLAAQPASSR